MYLLAFRRLNCCCILIITYFSSQFSKFTVFKMNIFFVILHNFQFNSTFFKKEGSRYHLMYPRTHCKNFFNGKKVCAFFNTIIYSCSEIFKPWFYWLFFLSYLEYPFYYNVDNSTLNIVYIFGSASMLSKILVFWKLLNVRFSRQKFQTLE